MAVFTDYEHFHLLISTLEEKNHYWTVNNKNNSHHPNHYIIRRFKLPRNVRKKVLTAWTAKKNDCLLTRIIETKTTDHATSKANNPMEPMRFSILTR